jgi:hypothetical protein
MLCPQNRSVLFALLQGDVPLSFDGAGKMPCQLQYATGSQLGQYCTTQPTSRYQSAAIVFSAVCDAFIEALAAYRQYEHLMSCGMPHDAALRFAICSPDEVNRRRVAE